MSATPSSLFIAVTANGCLYGSDVNADDAMLQATHDNLYAVVVFEVPYSMLKNTVPTIFLGGAK